MVLIKRLPADVLADQVALGWLDDGTLRVARSWLHDGATTRDAAPAGVPGEVPGARCVH